ncbi:hypothetical protein JKP88DRAFT_346718 [Tribonema minus]|uniref:Vitamin K epoxide reductase domain-containing protein n=1 Tax=Tribonema minus TaxID=303371 RepID=A0A836CDR7_9STRA|nr:hypothetical protein JKP88DRAFT_346718 [Tribonema minus]
MAAYGAVAALALVPLLLSSRAAREAGADAQALAMQRAAGVDGWTRSWLLVITTAMATFSAYLMGVLAFRIGAFCPYCFLSLLPLPPLLLLLLLLLLSALPLPPLLLPLTLPPLLPLLQAVLSFGMCAIAWVKGAVPGKTRAAVTGLATVLITAMGALGVFVITEITISDAGAVTTEAMRPPSISTASTPQSVRLAKRLEKLDAAMYGAYWCSHCHHQKELFGAEAFARIKYVECSTKGWQERADVCRAPQGWQAAPPSVPLRSAGWQERADLCRTGWQERADLCRAKDVPGYPTWEINGELYPGEKSLEELERISGLAPYKQP